MKKGRDRDREAEREGGRKGEREIRRDRERARVTNRRTKMLVEEDCGEDLRILSIIFVGALLGLFFCAMGRGVLK